MIKLIRGKKPKQLTGPERKKLTDDFIKSGKKKAVWNLKYLKANLLKFSFNKCCYCEMNITEESKYLEVEHFQNKDLYPKEVINWENLLPSCKTCNVSKGVHDVIKEPIIDPTKIEPKLHLFSNNYRIKGKDTIGKMTVSVLNLNDSRHCIARFLIGGKLTDEFEKLNELAENYLSGITINTRTKNRIIVGTKALLRQGLPESSYAAITASSILNDLEYNELKLNINKMGFWDKELMDLESKISKIAL